MPLAGSLLGAGSRLAALPGAAVLDEDVGTLLAAAARKEIAGSGRGHPAQRPPRTAEGKHVLTRLAGKVGVPSVGAVGRMDVREIRKGPPTHPDKQLREDHIGHGAGQVQGRPPPSPSP